jgi:protein-L-isoaspartate(D-aspartate) O-methyltransferase
MLESAVIRRNMIDTQLRTYDVNSKRLLDAFESVEREHFVPEAFKGLAYLDQTISLPGEGGEQRGLLPPMVLARMIQAADIQVGETVLDVAGGSGYGAAIMAAMGATVTLLESNAAFGAIADTSLAKAGMSTVKTRVGGFERGLPKKHRPAKGGFDIIIVNGSMDNEPTGLLSQLNDAGRLVTVIGSGRAGRVTVFLRTGETIGRHSVLDASAPVLAAFRHEKGFQF